jgi:hypothetical protein
MEIKLELVIYQKLWLRDEDIGKDRSEEQNKVWFPEKKPMKLML